MAAPPWLLVGQDNCQAFRRRLGRLVILIYCTNQTLFDNQSKEHLSSHSAGRRSSHLSATTNRKDCDVPASKLATPTFYIFAWWLPVFLSYSLQNYSTIYHRISSAMNLLGNLLVLNSQTYDFNPPQIVSRSQFKPRHIMKTVYCYGEKF
jgi:hypothetical protein